MKNVQVRFSDEVYASIKHLAEEEHATVADVVRKGIQLYSIILAYQKEGKKLVIVDANSDELHAELIIPGITVL